jgi:hypothetical protein
LKAETQFSFLHLATLFSCTLNLVYWLETRAIIVSFSNIKRFRRRRSRQQSDFSGIQKTHIAAAAAAAKLPGAFGGADKQESGAPNCIVSFFVCQKRLFFSQKKST